MCDSLLDPYHISTSRVHLMWFNNKVSMLSHPNTVPSISWIIPNDIQQNTASILSSPQTLKFSLNRTHPKCAES